MSPSSSSSQTKHSSMTQKFANLAIVQDLRPGSERYRKAREHFIVREFEGYFGEDTKLGNWQKLCEDLGIAGEKLRSITKCKKALNRVWVNIWDLLSAVQQGKRVKLWKTEAALAEYTRKHRLYYPKARAKEQGPVRALLARIT